MLEKLFKLKENKTNVRTELIAGLTTFMTMAYILAVNPSILGDASVLQHRGRYLNRYHLLCCSQPGLQEVEGNLSCDVCACGTVYPEVYFPLIYIEKDLLSGRSFFDKKIQEFSKTY